ncbi:MAG: hypothetical protein RIG27_12195 [Coleofasciculus sp. F4-SAH-05]
MTENTTATPEKTNTHVDNGNQQQRQDSEATAEKPSQHPEADQEDLNRKKSPQSSQLKTKLNVRMVMPLILSEIWRLTHYFFWLVA